MANVGIIKFWSASKGFGFIIPDDGSSDVFAHINDVVDDVDELLPGQKVSFELVTNRKTGRTQAESVSIIRKHADV